MEFLKPARAQFQPVVEETMDDARFEDLPAWRKAMDLAVLVHRVSGEPEFVQETVLREEAVKTAITIPSRVAEGLRSITSWPLAGLRAAR
jgi:hypothetical protein